MFDEFIETCRLVHEAFPHFWTGVFFVFGAIVGSFLNVCILRIPRGESIVSPGSHCACGAPIKIWNNIPILSWFVLRGRAACCGRPFSIRYTLIETLTAVFFAVVWELFPPQLAAGLMIYFSLALVAAVQDFDSMEIPVSVLAVFILAGTACGFFLTGTQSSFVGNIFSTFTGLAVGTTIVSMFRIFGAALMKQEAMGEGDVYLLAGIGAFFGWRAAVFAFFAGAVLGLVFYLLCKIIRIFRPCSLEYSEDDGVPDGEARVPFGPPMLLAGTIYIFLEYFCPDVFILHTAGFLN